MSQDREGRRSQAQAVIAEISGTDAGQLEPGMNLVADLGIDSPRALQLLVTLEERLEVEISDEDAARMETVGDILDYAERAEAGAATGS